VAPGAHLRQATFAGCRAGSEVTLMVIELPRDQGGGHVWPGGRGDLATHAAPPTLDATQVVLDFFARHQ
jgi:poly(3-hydroxybutyrate) depolymerase